MEKYFKDMDYEKLSEDIAFKGKRDSVSMSMEHISSILMMKEFGSS